MIDYINNTLIPLLLSSLNEDIQKRRENRKRYKYYYKFNTSEFVYNEDYLQKTIKINLFKFNKKLNKEYKANYELGKKTLGDFIIKDDIIFYNHLNYRSNMYYKFIKTLKNNNIDFKYIGTTIIFNYNNLNVNDYLKINDKFILFRTKHTKIKGVFVPSKRANRFFIIKNNSLYVENSAWGKWFSNELYKEIFENDINEDLFNIIPMLYSTNYYIKTIKDLEEYYSIKMLNVLTT